MTRRVPLFAGALVLGALALSLLAGCGAIFGSRYDNFRAYFNTFYNAERAFDEAEEQIVRDDQPIDRERYLQVLPRPDERVGGVAGGGGFEEVVEKCARLLRESPDTKYTDDALLLIGKSYFYQGNFEGAKLNLREAIRVAQEEGRQREEDEARLWLGRALAANGESGDAAATLRESIDREGAEPEWTSLMRLALAQLHVQDQRWEEAAAALTEGIARVEDDDLAARAQFLLGQVYETMGRFDDAARAYAQVLRYRPLYELRYAAQLSEVVALGLGAGQTGGALERLRRMQRDDNNFSNLPELEVTEARVLAEAGRPRQARDLLRDLLYADEGRGIGQMRGEALYRLAEVYRNGFEDFSLAAAYLDSAATALRAPAIRRSELTTQALLDVDEEAETYLRFADAARLVADYDSLLELGSLDEDAFRARVVEIQEQRQLAAAEEEARLERQRAEQGFRGNAAGGMRSSPGTGAPGAAATATGGDDFGFLSFRNPARVQEAYASFTARWGERPLVPNWRRRAAINIAIAEGDISEEDAAATFAPTAAGLGIDVTAVPRTPEAQTAMRAEQAAALYEMGNALFLALGRPDSAAAVYRLVVEEAADETIAERAYYTLAEVERSLGRGAEADRWYRHVIETYPNSELANQARERLGLARATPTVAEQDRAREAYALAYATWQEGDYARAYRDLLTVSERFPESDIAPRALLAAGHVYTEWAGTGSVDLFEPLPQADTLDLPGLYEQVATRYAGTPFARRASALRDALEEARPVPDSTAQDSFAADGLAADSLALPDLDDPDLAPPPSPAEAAPDTTAEVPPDSLATAPPAPTEDAEPSHSAMPPGLDMALRSTEPIEPRAGTTTWALATYQEQAPAEEALRALARQGYQAAILREERGELARFIVVVGQFESINAATSALPAVRLLASEGVQPYQLSLGGAEVVLQGADARADGPR